MGRLDMVDSICGDPWIMGAVGLSTRGSRKLLAKGLKSTCVRFFSGKADGV